MKEKDKIQPLLDSLKDENSFARRQAIKSLEQLADKSVIPSLAEVMLQDESAYVRRAVASAFQGKLADKSAVPALIKALKDEIAYVRAVAAVALGKINDESALERLKEALGDSDPHVRSSAIIALGSIGEKSVIGMLKKLLEDPREFSFVKNSATAVLRKLGEAVD